MGFLSKIIVSTLFLATTLTRETSATGSSYTKLENKLCITNEQIGEYKTMNEARAACDVDTNCASIYDAWCDGLGLFRLCRINVEPRNSRLGGCLYVKQSIFAPENKWVKGSNGKNCSYVCNQIGRDCDADMQSTLTTEETLVAAFKEAGYTCKSFGGSRTFEGFPCSTGRVDKDCYAISGKSVCEPNPYPHHSALCSCKKRKATTTTIAPTTASSYIGHAACSKKCSPATLGGACMEISLKGCPGYCNCGDYKCKKCDCSQAPICQECNVNGAPGDGTEHGSCFPKFCHSDGHCYPFSAATTTIAPTTTKPGDDCKDLASKCWKYKTEDGFCASSKGQSLCFKSCGLCKEKGGGEKGNWKYPSGDNKDFWKEGVCKTGFRQSPIKINTTLSPATIHAPLKYLSYFTNTNFNNKWHKGLLENDGHTIVWHFGGHGGNKETPFKKCGSKQGCPSIRKGPFGGDKHSHSYHLLQLQFHWGSLGDNSKGSEHVLDGKRYPLEMHLVHIEDKFINFKTGKFDWEAAVKDKYGLAILAIFFYVDDLRAQNLKPLSKISEEAVELNNPSKLKREADDKEHEDSLRNLQEALDELNSQESNGKSKRATEVKLRLNPGAFIRKATNDYYGCFSTYFTYHGSLTTPGCNEVVTWVVFTKPLSISQVQVNAFKSRFQNNYRDIEKCSACMERSPNGGGLDCEKRGSLFIHDEIQAHKGIWG